MSTRNASFNQSYNPNVAQLQHPPIPLIQKAANRYNNKAGPLIDLSQAVPGYSPPSELLEALKESASSPSNHGYGNIEGEPMLRSAYAEDLNQKHSSSLVADNVMITAGCNQAFVIAALSVAKPDDSILLITPWYFNHKTSIEMLGIKTRFCQTNPSNGFLPEFSDIEAALDESVRAVVIVSPNNPTGAVYPDTLITEVYELCVKSDRWLIMDETYQDFLPTYQDNSHDLFNAPFGKNFISITSFSKSYCIPGQRLGAIVAGQQTVSEMTKVMDNLQICAPLSAQIALGACLPKLREWREKNRKVINDRAKALERTVEQLPDWNIDSIGAYFAYVSNVKIGMSSSELAEKLALEYGVVTLPGAFFGQNQDNYLRVAFANVEADVIATLSTRIVNI